MKKTYTMGDRSLRNLHALIELQSAFADFTRKRWFGFRNPSIEEFARIVANAKTDLWSSLFSENPSLRGRQATASFEGIVTWDEHEEEK